MAFEWRKVGTSFDISWIYSYSKGGLPPPPEEEVKGKSFMQITDIGVKRIHAPDGGLGVPWSCFYWSWTLMLVYYILLATLFYATTPLGDEFPWLTLLHKSLILFNVWESLGLGVLSGPLHGRVAPPFIDWWYRFTPGTIKYNAPFMPAWLPQTRNYIDVLVGTVLTYGFSLRCLLAPEVTPELVTPLALCGIYEFVFDYGQHMHDYGTQNLHCFVCMCFPVGRGQLVGMQLFLSLLYFCSGFGKIGPTFQYIFTTGNAIAPLFNCLGTKWIKWYRKAMFVDLRNEDYRLTRLAWWLAATAAMTETTAPLLMFTRRTELVYFSIFTLVSMHAFIVGTAPFDMYVWNSSDAMWYTIIFGVLHTGFAFDELPNLHPALAAWLLCHAAYVLYGTIVPDAVPYIVAHRHWAGNWAHGVLVIKKSAEAKLGKLKMYDGSLGPCSLRRAPGWAGEWASFHQLWAFAWNWTVSYKILHPLVVDTMGAGAPTDFLHSSGDYVLIHSAPFFDALLGHLRFDGLCNVALMSALQSVCVFEEGECRLCFAGAFPSFVLVPRPKATWKVVDAKTGVIKEGTYTADMVDGRYKKPSDAIPELMQILEGKLAPPPVARPPSVAKSKRV